MSCHGKVDLLNGQTQHHHEVMTHVCLKMNTHHELQLGDLPVQNLQSTVMFVYRLRYHILSEFIELGQRLVVLIWVDIVIGTRYETFQRFHQVHFPWSF